MEVEQRALWTRDWINDLTDFPIEAIRVACRKWRQSGVTKFPTPGQLLPMVRENVAGETGVKYQPWRPASDEDYRSMPVREKIRERLILSHEAFCKAGPMFRNATVGGVMAKAAGDHLTAGEMRSTHEHWTAIGRNHAREAQMLREHLRGDHREAAE
jgi:hypothetical protein